MKNDLTYHEVEMLAAYIHDELCHMIPYLPESQTLTEHLC